MIGFTPSAELARHVGRLYGKYSGQVTDDADPLQLGRIQVTVPSVFPEDQAVWARPCFPPGHFFVPPVGAAVWVEFEAGDPGYPVWVGTWYPQGTVPTQADKSPPTGRVVHTPTGHVVEFQDEAGEEKVVIRHRLDSFVALDKEGSVLVANKNGSYLFLNAKDAQTSLTGEQGHMVTIGDDGIVVVHGAGARVEVADGKVKITGPDAVQIVTKDLSLSGSSIRIGGAAANFSAVLGEGLMAMYNVHTHATAVGPSSPPIPPLTPGPPVFSQSVKVQ